MAAPYDAERSVTAADAEAAIAAAFPSLAPVRAAAAGEGWDNFAFRVNDELLFRFPRRQVAVELLEKEYRILPAIAHRLPLPVPRPEFFAPSGANFPWPFLGHRLIPGQTACGAALDDDERQLAARALAEFLRALHATAVAGAPPDRIRKLDFEYRAPIARTNLEKLRAAGLISKLENLLEILENPPQFKSTPTGNLVHGDLYVRHLLIDSNRRLCGVIDWGDVHAGDPAVDLAVAHSFLPPRAHDEFRRAYGELDEARWQLARLRALWHSAVLALYAHDVGDKPLVAEALRALAWIDAAA